MSSPSRSGLAHGSFEVGQRVMRGYGPGVVIAVTLLVVSVLVPSKPPERVALQSASPRSPAVPGSAATGPDGAVEDPGRAEIATAAGAAGDPTGPAASAPGTSGGCPDRTDQVPGDPYSPPCIAFSGSNGGATSRGVTESTIRVTFRVLDERGYQQTLAEMAGATLTDTPETVSRTVLALAEYINERFQLYGRRIEIVLYEGRGSTMAELLGQGRELAVADAIQAAEELGAFADISAVTEPYAGALAERGVIALGTPYLSRAWHEARAPYAWSLNSDGSIVSELAGEYLVKKLYGGTADHAGGDLRGTPRAFATLAPQTAWYQESVENGQAVVKAAGHDAPYARSYVLDLGTLSDQATRIIADFKSRGITTILCACDPIMIVFLSGVGHRERYYPELIIAGLALVDLDIVGQLWNQEFASHAFGVSPLQSFLPPTQTIAYAAYKSVRDDEPAFSVDLIYYQMYMLAIGIQMAGPHLDPTTFEAGMFAYPARSGPFGLWRFGPGDRTAANDVREIYWDPEAISIANGRPGAWVEANDGARFESGEIPATPPGRPVDVGLT